MRKKHETFVFFTINDSPKFKTTLKTSVVSQITSAAQLLQPSGQSFVAVNVAFSQSGLSKLGVTDDLKDATFTGGQSADATNLGDPGTVNWVGAFKDRKSMHGVLLVASDTQKSIDAQMQSLRTAFGSSMSILYTLPGRIRSGRYAGHEHFGFLDGIGQPAISGWDISPRRGQQVVTPGIILAGEPGDTVRGRPLWTKDGSFLAFRQLKQLVPEFEAFIDVKAPAVDGLTAHESKDLFAARMVGRWKSGTPVDLAPLRDNPAIGADSNRNNDFTFLHGDNALTFNSDQSRCPFHAHIRKTRPRADLPSPLNAIMRCGIPYGGEVTSGETRAKTSSPDIRLERGLAFVAYQSNLANGFQFLQKAWANNPNFITNKTVAPGFDPIIGANHGGQRFISGWDLKNTSSTTTLQSDFVVSRGGEYFFSPSISALRDVIAA
ncbi:DyP-type peroxidase [Auriculariales sp. MPI-PUGE-AT-0066]|nr:DyP-type peroxidase [Auriculariales sp. MPI-PUGE-AT-0066]